MRRLYLYGLLVFFLSGCNPDDEGTLQETLVVDGLVYVGQTIQLRLSSLAAVNGASQPYNDTPFIGIESDEQGFPLLSDPALPGRYYDPSGMIPLAPGTGLVVFIPFKDTLVLAATEIPFPPEDMKLDRAIIPLNASDLETENADTLRWRHSNRPFTAKITVVGPNPVKINPGEADPANEFVLAPVTGDRYAIPHHMLRYYGIYRLVLYSVNPEYVQFFASGSQSQVQQSSPVSNGLGLFTAINSDTSYFFVVPR